MFLYVLVIMAVGEDGVMNMVSCLHASTFGLGFLGSVFCNST